MTTPNTPNPPEAGLAALAAPPMMLAELARTWSLQTLHYTSMRLQAHAQHLEGLSRCTSLQDVFDRQMAFIGETASQFSDGLAHAMQPTQDAPPAPTEGATPAVAASPAEAQASRPRPTPPRPAAERDMAAAPPH